MRNREIQLGRLLHNIPEADLFSKQNELIITNWLDKLDSGITKAVTGTESDGRPTIRFVAEEPASSSWRSQVTIPRGSYVLEAEVVTNNLRTYRGNARSGVALRISGATPDETLKANGKHFVRYKFSVLENRRTVELICEMKDCQGEIGFYLDNLKLTRSKLLF